MKEMNDVGKIMAAVLVITCTVAVISVPVVDADDAVEPVQIDAVDFLALAEDGTITLESDFTLTTALEISVKITIDLNGHSINGSIAGVATGENGNGKELLFLIDSNINIINTADTEGVIAVNDGNTTSKTIYYDAIYAERTNLTIENVTIQSLNNDGEGIAFLGEYGNDEISSNYENTSTFYTLNIIDSKILGYAQAIIGNGAFHGTIINIENSEITATDGWAIYHPQYGILNVKGTNTTITGIGAGSSVHFLFVANLNRNVFILC